MLRTSLFSLAIFILFYFCKAKDPKAVSSRPAIADDQKTIGTVSHKHGKCGTVVLVKAVGPELILVPYPALDKNFDVDGLSIQFTYRNLRMPKREDCDRGVMAELKEVAKSN